MRPWLLALALEASLFGDVRVTIEAIQAVTRAPLEGVTLRLNHANDQLSSATVAITGADGRAEVVLEPGKYILYGERIDLGFVSYMPLVDNWMQRVVILPSNESQTVVFLIPPPVTVSGFVRDELGNPIAYAHVQLYKPTWADGRLTMTSPWFATTDDRGRYTMRHVRHGNYVLCASPQSTEARPVPVIGTFDFAAPPPLRYYTRTCLPTREPDAARTIHLDPGVTASYDFVLESAPGIVIRGHLSEPVNTGISLRPRTATNDLSTFRASTDSGKFSFRGIPPGKYRLEAEASVQTGETTEQRYGSLDIDASGADIADLVVTLERRPTVELTFDEESPGLAQSVTNVALVHAGGESTSLAAAKATDVKSGENWLYHTTSGNVCIVGALLDGQPVFRQKFAMAAGVSHRLVVRVSSRCSPPREVQTVSHGKVVPFARIVFLLSGTLSSPGFVYAAVADPDGEFTLTGIAPGRYLAWAWVDTTVLENDPRAYVGPPDLASVEAQATVLDLAEEDASKVEIPVLNPPRQ